MKYNGKPREAKTTKQTQWMINKSMRDLTTHSISVAASPNSVATGFGSPYPIIAAQNKVIDTNYAGDNNITGNTIIEIANNPLSSYLESIDLTQLRIALNYGYMAIDADDKNVAVNEEVNKAMTEALAAAFAETFTQLPFFNYRIKTTMPGTGDPANDADQKRYLAFAVFYQTVLQNIVHVVQKFNNCLALEKTLLDQAWLREVPQLKQLYGLFHKTALRSTFQALANYVPGSALDLAWLTQCNILTNVPCKRSDSYDDPLISVLAYTRVPDIEVYVGEGDDKVTIFKYSETDADSNYLIDIGGTSYTFTDLVSAIVSALDPYNIQVWARQVYEGNNALDARGYFNTLVDLVNGLITMLSRFPSDTADFDVVLKVMGRAGLNNWTYNVTPVADAPGKEYHPVFNKLLYDIVAARCGGGDDMVFDANTRRWKFYTTWDRVDDIPEYDMKSGGAFLVFSLRNLPSDTDYTTTKWLIPIMFKMDENDIVVADRRGFETELDYTTYDFSEVRSDPVLARLAPLPSMTDLTLRVPTINISANTDHQMNSASFAAKFISKMCGLGRVIWTIEGQSYEHVVLDSTMQNMLDEQMEDVSNSMISQARVSAPFKVAVAQDVRSMGFVKVVS